MKGRAQRKNNMKKLLVGLLALGSISVFASEYRSIEFKCSMSATQQDIVETTKTKLGNTLHFNIQATEEYDRALEAKNKSHFYNLQIENLKKKNKTIEYLSKRNCKKYYGRSECKKMKTDKGYERIDVIIEDLGVNPLSIKEVVKEINYFDGQRTGNAFNIITYKFIMNHLSRNDFEYLLSLMLDQESVPTPATGIKQSNLLKHYSDHNGFRASYRSAYSSEERNGLAYNLNLECKREKHSISRIGNFNESFRNGAIVFEN